MKPGLSGVALWLLIVAGALLLWLLIPGTFWPYAFLLRVPLVMGLLLFSLPFIALFVVPSVLRNLYVMRGLWQVAFTVLASIAAAMAVVSVGAIILENAHARFGLPVLSTPSDGLYFLLAILICLPSVATITYLSREEIQAAALGGLVVGLGLGGAFIAIFEAVRKLIDSSQMGSGEAFPAWITPINQLLVKLVALLGQNPADPGYIDPRTGNLSSAHLDTLAFFIALLAVYLGTFWIYRPRITKAAKSGNRREAAALYHAILLLAIGTLFIGSLTFFFDYWRVSVLLFWLIITASSYVLFRVDHFFSIFPSGNQGGNNPLHPEASVEATDFLRILRRRMEKQTGSDPLACQTLVIICSSGGGIQAAGWTTQVLSGLQQTLGQSFTRAIGLISSVSGGSVGSMYYLDRFGPEGYPAHDQLDAIFESATADSLDAVSWGLAYPDFWRLISLPFLTRFLPEKLRDRGRTIEVDWQCEMEEPMAPKRLSDWKQQVEAGTIPIPVMNSTSVEDGFRCLISPLSFATCSPDKAHDFHQLYPGKDINVVTAARLSATFPYASPVCRDDQNLKPKVYFADGGYFDNSGFVTALEWLTNLLNSKNCFLRRVLILQINAFPENPPATSAQTRPGSKAQKGRGFFMTTLGPLLTLFKVRDPVLNSRNRLEAELLQTWNRVKDQCDQQSINIQHYNIYFPSFSELKKKSTTKATELFSKGGTYQPPLSWKLTRKQQQLIREAWKITSHDPVIHAIKNLWHHDWNMEA